jgi:hypothetical protein
MTRKLNQITDCGARKISIDSILTHALEKAISYKEGLDVRG